MPEVVSVEVVEAGDRGTEVAGHSSSQAIIARGRRTFRPVDRVGQGLQLVSVRGHHEPRRDSGTDPRGNAAERVESGSVDDEHRVVGHRRNDMRDKRGDRIEPDADGDGTYRQAQLMVTCLREFLEDRRAEPRQLPRRSAGVLRRAVSDRSMRWPAAGGQASRFPPAS